MPAPLEGKNQRALTSPLRCRGKINCDQFAKPLAEENFAHRQLLKPLTETDFALRQLSKPLTEIDFARSQLSKPLAVGIIDGGRKRISPAFERNCMKNLRIVGNYC